MKKKLLKKLLKTLLASLLTFSIPLGMTFAYAANPGDPIIQDDTSNTSPINATVAQSYTITIPSLYNLGALTKTTENSYAYADGEVSASNILIGSNQILDVKAGVISPDPNPDSFLLTSNVGGTLGFDIYSAYTGSTEGTGIEHGTTILSVTNESAGDELKTNCHVGVNKKNITATETYTGSLTFTIAITPSA